MPKRGSKTFDVFALRFLATHAASDGPNEPAGSYDAGHRKPIAPDNRFCDLALLPLVPAASAA
jgi:hypothetical protein